MEAVPAGLHLSPSKGFRLEVAMQRAPMSERFALLGRPGHGERFPDLRLVLGKQPYQWFCFPRTTHNNLIVGQDYRQSGLVCSSQQA
jgi:hypothetical protein